jgi:hypothetical protein
MATDGTARGHRPTGALAPMPGSLSTAPFMLYLEGEGFMAHPLGEAVPLSSRAT